MRPARIWIVISVVVTLAACGPPFPTAPPTSTSPAAPKPAAPTTSTTSTTSTVTVPTTILPGTEPLACPGGSDVAASNETVPMVVDEPLEGMQLVAATIDAADDAVVDSAGDPSRAAAQGPTVVITSVVDGTPVVDSVAVPEALAAAAAAVSAGEVVAVEALSTVSLLEESEGLAGALASNDTQRGHLWAFDALDFERLWQCGTGSGISVAVVDSGVLGSHPDLVARVTPGWTKLDGAPGTVGGANVDPNGHGTHVAGIIGAVAGNSRGVAGVAPDVKIVPVRVLDGSGNGSDADVAAGITWAVDHGVEVINLSLGGDNASTAVLTALRYAETNGVVVVAAAGNLGEEGSPTIYPAAFDESIAVAAIDSTRAVADYSNRGDYVDVAAPGSGILSTFNTGGYAWSSGTSMAAPHVAGLAAVLLSAEPDLTALELRTRMIASVDDAGAPGFDDEYGHGIIHPVRALTDQG